VVNIAEEKTKSDIPEGTVLVGRKPSSNYVLAVMTFLNKNKEAKICARGNNIVRAVDVLEMTKRRLPGTKSKIVTSTTEINTERADRRTGRMEPVKLNISTIEITISINGK